LLLRELLLARLLSSLESQRLLKFPFPKLIGRFEASRPDRAGRIIVTNGRLVDIYFDYDRSELRSDALSALRENATLLAPILKEFPGIAIWIEGHCDERGSAEYNLGLGDGRARRVAEALGSLGLATANAHTLSYGREQPQCTEAGGVLLAEESARTYCGAGRCGVGELVGLVAVFCEGHGGRLKIGRRETFPPHGMRMDY
jgi:ribosomal protein S27AE